MTAATVYINGEALGEHRGGYTPFSFELTPHVDWEEDNLLAVEVDSTERPDIPPFGARIDYLTFGGIYREVSLRAVPEVFIENVFAKPVDVMDGPRVEVHCCFGDSTAPEGPFVLSAELRDGDQILASESEEISPDPEGSYALYLEGFGPVELWDLDTPKLYTVAVQLLLNDELQDEYAIRIGFREAWFTEEGFLLNGRRVHLRGLNRHQTYPYVGGAMPERIQRKDALILKQDLKCNVVRTSHYPQSRHFLDACDEIGLLVFEEMPGWQHIGGEEWKEVAYQNVEEMIRRDRNRPSVVIWGVRVNESPDDHDFYSRTNEIAHSLDDSRQTGGVRDFLDSEFLEDVFTVNDFDPNHIQSPNHPRYLVTEFAGHMFPTKHIDNVVRVREHSLRHARWHEMVGADDGISGGIAWCAFDYNTHSDCGSGDRVCYHGVSDIFRIPKPVAGFYRSQCDPGEEVVLEPAFHWSMGDRSTSTGPGVGVVFSNCDRLRIYMGEELLEEVEPDYENFGHLPRPPFFAEELGRVWEKPWKNLHIEGYTDNEKVISRSFSGRGVDEDFQIESDDAELVGDGSDATRVVLRVTDEYGAYRPFATGAVLLGIEGPGEIVGENPFALVGGVGAVWVKAHESSGTVQLSATHQFLGERTIEIRVRQSPEEVC